MAECYCMHLKDPKLSRFNVEFNFNKSKGGGIYPFARYIGTTATTNGILLAISNVLAEIFFAQ